MPPPHRSNMRRLTMAEKKQRTPEEMEKALAAANEALEKAKKEAEDAKEAAKAAEEVMRGMSAKEADDGMVSFFAFKDDDKYKDDIVVGLNGRMYRIQRGKHVRIPRDVYDIIRQSMAQDAATAEMLEQKSREYEAVKQQLN